MTGDLLSETRTSFVETAQREGVHISTVWRWAQRGIDGHVLASFSCGGRKYTTREAFKRWIAAINGEPIRSETPRQRERAIKRAERRAQELKV
jgi:hypothetical protein